MIKPMAGRLAATTALALGLAAAATGVTGLLLAGRGPTTAGAIRPSPPSAAPIGRVDLGAAPNAGTRTPRPVELIIPAIGVRARLVDLGLTSSGTVQVPADPDSPGWYTGSPRPGAIGSSIQLGHVDSLAGPAVFFRLGTMRPGERIYVGRSDGTFTVFHADAVRWYLKTRFPATAVYGPTPDRELRLITCCGVFDQQLKSYLSNVVVYATAIS